MTPKEARDTSLNDPFAQWNQALADMWGGVMHLWFPDPTPEAAAAEGAPAGKAARQARASADAALRNWQAMAAAMSAPGSVEALFKGVGGMPQILAHFAGTSLGGLLEMQSRVLERLGRLGDHVDAYTFSDMDENLFRTWTEMYEKEFSRFFQIPKLGLVREYQERISRSLDAYNRHQATLIEFLRLLALPLGRSFAVLQEEMGVMAEEGRLPEDGRAYYEMWVKILEGHYMTLFQTPEYVQTLARTLDSLSAFQTARNAVIEDMLQGMPVPTRSEIDDLYEEIHRLKRRLRKMENALREAGMPRAVENL